MTDAADISIRSATEADCATIADLMHELARATGHSLPMDPGYPDVFLAHPDNGCLMADLDGRAVGMLAYSIRPNLFHGGPAGVIEEFVVDPDVRRRGVGSALLCSALDLFGEEGCVEISLNTDLDNERAQSVYRRVGLTEESLQLAIHPRQRNDWPTLLSRARRPDPSRSR